MSLQEDIIGSPLRAHESSSRHLTKEHDKEPSAAYDGTNVITLRTYVSDSKSFDAVSQFRSHYESMSSIPEKDVANQFINIEAQD